jgi:hypothetical protein
MCPHSGNSGKEPSFNCRQAKKIVVARQAVHTPASFRSYPSYRESVADYVEFLRSNPRYVRALQLVDDPVGFAHALQNAGYATDPGYARKIIDILNGEVLTQAVLDLKLPLPAPLSESTEDRGRIDSG